MKNEIKYHIIELNDIQPFFVKMKLEIKCAFLSNKKINFNLLVRWSCEMIS